MVERLSPPLQNRYAYGGRPLGIEEDRTILLALPHFNKKRLDSVNPALRMRPIFFYSSSGV